jgi:hypothetical protein
MGRRSRGSTCAGNAGVLDEILGRLAPAQPDIVITEGFRDGPFPKIEVVRRAIDEPHLCGPSDGPIALVTDADWDRDVPRFRLNDVESLAEFVVARSCPSGLAPSSAPRGSRRRPAVSERDEEDPSAANADAFGLTEAGQGDRQAKAMTRSDEDSISATIPNKPRPVTGTQRPAHD